MKLYKRFQEERDLLAVSVRIIVKPSNEPVLEVTEYVIAIVTCLHYMPKKKKKMGRSEFYRI